MNDQLFQILIIVFCSLMSIIGAFIAWWVNNIHTTVKTQGMDIANLKLEVVRDYVPRKELQQTCDKIFDKIDEMSRSLQHLANNQAGIRALQSELKERSQ